MNLLSLASYDKPQVKLILNKVSIDLVIHLNRVLSVAVVYYKLYLTLIHLCNVATARLLMGCVTI